MTEEKQIIGLMSKVMAEIGPISKDQTNTFQKYKFRGIDDIYNACQSVLCKHGVVVIPYVQSVERHERLSKDGGALMFTLVTVDYTFYAPDGSNVVARTIGEGMDSSDKSSNKSMTSAHKYLFVQTFCIGTTEPKDSEHDTPEPMYKKQAIPVNGSHVEKVDTEDWENMMTIGEQNRWPRGYMNQWIKDRQKRMKEVDIYQEGLAKFGKINDKAEVTA